MMGDYKKMSDQEKAAYKKGMFRGLISGIIVALMFVLPYLCKGG